MKSKRWVNLINCNNQEFWNIKLSKFLTTLSLTATLATAQMVGLPNQKPKEAQAQSNRPYVVLVNGYQDCCIWATSNRGVYMGTVVSELQKQGAEFRLVPWDTFRDGAGQRSSTSNDAAFLQEAADFINNQLDPNRPLILIGHSFGGDSLLSLVPRINRRIQFLGVIDPTAAGGLREPVTRRGVPSNVDYFFNRWEQNALTGANVVPFDSRLVGGSISGCQAKNCDQQEQSLARNENGSEIRVKCGSLEVTCTGYNPIPVFMGGSNGTKAKRLAHNDMPSDAYLQRQMANRINQALTVSQSPVVQPITFIKSVHGNYFLYHRIADKLISLNDQPYNPATGENNGNNWVIVPIGQGVVNIKSVHGNYFLSHNVAQRSVFLNDQPYNPATGENNGNNWVIVSIGQGAVSIKSVHGNYFLSHNVAQRSIFLNDQPYNPATGENNGNNWFLITK